MCYLDFFGNNWKEIVATLIAVFSLWKYFDARIKELNWNRTEFLFEQSRYLDTELDIQYVVSIIDGENKITINESISKNGKLINDDDNFRIGLHKLLNMLDRLAYAVESIGTISMNEVSHFGWYFTSIHQNKNLTEYCNRNGYKSVITLAEKVDLHFKTTKG